MSGKPKQRKSDLKVQIQWCDCSDCSRDPGGCSDLNPCDECQGCHEEKQAALDLEFEGRLALGLI